MPAPGWLSQGVTGTAMRVTRRIVAEWPKSVSEAATRETGDKRLSPNRSGSMRPVFASGCEGKIWRSAAGADQAEAQAVVLAPGQAAPPRPALCAVTALLRISRRRLRVPSRSHCSPSTLPAYCVRLSYDGQA